MLSIHNYFSAFEQINFHEWSEYEAKHPLLLDDKVKQIDHDALFQGTPHPDLTIATDLDTLITQIVRKHVNVTDNTIHTMMNRIRIHTFTSNEVRLAVITILRKLLENEKKRFPGGGDLEKCVLCTIMAINNSSVAVPGMEQCSSCKPTTVEPVFEKPRTRVQVSQLQPVTPVQAIIPVTKAQQITPVTPKPDTIPDLTQQQTQPVTIENLNGAYELEKRNPKPKEEKSFIQSWLLVPVYVISLGLSIGLVARRR